MPSLNYEPLQNGVSPAMTSPDAQGANYSGAVGQAIQGIGNQAEKLTNDYARITHMQTVADQKVKLDSNMANGFSDFTKYMETQKGLAGQPNSGISENGEGFTDSFFKAYDPWSKSLIDQQTTPQTKVLAANQAKTLGNHFLTNAMQWESQARSAYRVENINQALTVNAANTQQNSDLYKTLLDNQLQSLHESMGELHSPAQMAQLDSHIRNTMSQAGSLGFTQDHPQQTISFLTGEHPLPPDSVQAKIVQAANDKGVDPKVALAQAQLESGMQPGIKNPLPGATSQGLFQQNQANWDQYGQGAERGDTDAEVRAGVAQMADTQKAMSKTLGHDPTPYDQRLGHWFGVAGGSAIAKSSDGENLGDVMSKFDKNPQQTLQANGLNSQTTVGDLKHLVQVNMDKAMQQNAGYASAPSQEDGSSTDNMPQFFKDLTPQARQAMLTHAQTLNRKDMTNERAGIEGRLNDASAAWERGQDAQVQPPSLAEWQHAYGPGQGLVKFQKQQETQTYGANYAQMATASLAEQQAIYNSTAGAKDAHGMALHDALGKATNAVNQQRSADMMGFAQQQGLAAPLDLSNPSTLTQQLTARNTLADQLGQQWSLPSDPLSKDEAVKLGDFVSKGEPDAVKSVLLSMRAADSGDLHQYKAALGQIAPNHPIVSVAGMIADRNPSAATLMLQGNKMLFPDKDGKGGKSELILPGDGTPQGFSAAWHDAGMDQAYSSHQQSAQQAFIAAKAYYVAAQPAGDRSKTTLDSDLWKKAMDAATGGAVDYNGAKTLPPYGMKPADFADQVSTVWPHALADNGLDAKDHPANGYNLESVDNGVYLVKSGAGYLRGSTGQPVVVDLLGQQPSQALQEQQMTSKRPAKVMTDTLPKRSR